VEGRKRIEEWNWSENEQTGATNRAIAVVTASVASANYHFVHYAGNSAPYTPIFERFQVESLPAGVVPYFIQEPPATLAIQRWRYFPVAGQPDPCSSGGVEFSGYLHLPLHLRRDGDPESHHEHARRAGELRRRVAAGIVALGGPITRGDMVTPANGTDVRAIIQSSLVIGVDIAFSRRIQQRSGPSWSDRLFLTLVHELGHTAGLQHTWTSSIMSTEITRAMTKAHPLGPDDVAGILDALSHLVGPPAYGSVRRWRQSEVG